MRSNNFLSERFVKLVTDRNPNLPLPKSVRKWIHKLLNMKEFSE